MNSLIEALGLDLRILLAQFVNFAILVFVLWRFAYKPVFKILEERRSKIEKGIDDAHKAEKKLAESTEKSKEIIAEARREASSIIEASQTKAEDRYKEIVKSAQTDISLQTEKEMEKIKAEKNVLKAEVKKEMSELLVLSLEKFLNERMDDDKDKQVIEKIVKELS